MPGPSLSVARCPTPACDPPFAPAPCGRRLAPRACDESLVAPASGPAARLPGGRHPAACESSWAGRPRYRRAGGLRHSREQRVARHRDPPSEGLLRPGPRRAGGRRLRVAVGARRSSKAFARRRRARHDPCAGASEGRGARRSPLVGGWRDARSTAGRASSAAGSAGSWPRHGGRAGNGRHSGVDDSARHHALRRRVGRTRARAKRPARFVGDGVRPAPAVTTVGRAGNGGAISATDCARRLLARGR